MKRARRVLRTGVLTLALGGAPLTSASGQSLPPAQTVQQTLDRSDAAANLAPGTPPSTNIPGATPLPPGSVVVPGAILQGRLPIQFGATVGGYYDDNIYIQPYGPQRIGDYIWSVSPFIAWNSAAETGAKNVFLLSYSPTFIFYQNQTHNDAIDHAGHALYAFEDDRVNFSVTEVFGRFQESNADFGNLMEETTSVTTIILDYQLTGKTSLDFTTRQIYTQDDPGLRSTEWTQSGYFTYTPTPKTSFGLGGVLGIVALQGRDQAYQQLNGQVNYQPTAKLNFNLTAGVEWRETQGHGGANISPDFSLGATYQPFDGTSVGLDAYRRYEYSGRVYGNDYLSTGVSPYISQRFLHKFYGTLSASFENAQYRDNFSDSDTGQGYDFFTVRSDLGYSPATGCDLRVFYQYRESIDRGGIPGFADNQLGFSASFTY